MFTWRERSWVTCLCRMLSDANLNERALTKIKTRLVPYTTLILFCASTLLVKNGCKTSLNSFLYNAETETQTQTQKLARYEEKIFTGAKDLHWWFSSLENMTRVPHIFKMEHVPVVSSEFQEELPQIVGALLFSQKNNEAKIKSSCKLISLKMHHHSMSAPSF